MRVARAFSSEGSKYMTKRTQILWAQHAAMFESKMLVAFHDTRESLTVGVGDQQLVPPTSCFRVGRRILGYRGKPL